MFENTNNRTTHSTLLVPFSAPPWPCFLRDLHQSLGSAAKVCGSETGSAVSDLVSISSQDLFETTLLSHRAGCFYFHLFAARQHTQPGTYFDWHEIFMHLLFCACTVYLSIQLHWCTACLSSKHSEVYLQTPRHTFRISFFTL